MRQLWMLNDSANGCKNSVGTIGHAQAANRAPWTLQYNGNGYGPAFPGTVAARSSWCSAINYCSGNRAATINAMLPAGYALNVVYLFKPID